MFTTLSRTILTFAVGVAAMVSVGAADARAAGLLRPADGRDPELSISSHDVRVVVQDGYAVTRIEQTFANPHDREYEAIYSFPVPEKAAVSEFTYWIDGRPVTAEVLPKEKARRVYEEEKAAGREAALTEQDDYRTFDISVWPVQPGQDVRVRLVYYQPAHLDTGIGRYAYPLEEGGVDEAKLAFWTANDRVDGRFSFELILCSSYPVEAVRLPNHPHAVLSRTSGGDWRISLTNQAGASPASSPAAQPTAAAPDDGPSAAPLPGPATQQVRLDTDIIVYWRLKAGLPGRVEMVAHRPDPQKPGTFMMVLTPGDDLKPINGGADWSFVLDKSGSMQSKFHTLADGVERGLRKLRPSDRFRIVLFDEQAIPMTTAFQSATPENIDSAIHRLRRVQPGNGTNLYAGLDLGTNGLDADRTSAVLLVTDGVANVGEVRQRAFIDLVRKKDVRLFTFIIGNSANRPLLGAITRRSGGTAFSISNSDDIVGAIVSATGKVTHEALHDVTLAIDGVPVRDLTPEEFGSLYRGQQLIAFGHYRNHGPAEVTLSGKISGRPVTFGTRFDFPETASLNPEIERLWAFSRIEDMMMQIEDFGEKSEHRSAITDLAVEYGLVTPYTSMIVVREEVFAQLGIDRRNEQRVAMEDAARQQRAAQPVQSRRVDKAAPMYASAAPRHGGGGNGSGAIDPAMLLLIVMIGAPVLCFLLPHRVSAK